MAGPGLGCRRPRLPLWMPGRMDSRLMPVWGGMGMPDQQSLGARLQGGQCPPSGSRLLNLSPPPTFWSAWLCPWAPPKLCTQDGDTWISAAP